MINLPAPCTAARITAFLPGIRAGRRSGISDGLWRVAENDPDSDLYAASPDADTVIAYMTAHS